MYLLFYGKKCHGFLANPVSKAQGRKCDSVVELREQTTLPPPFVQKSKTLYLLGACKASMHSFSHHHCSMNSVLFQSCR